MRPVDRLSIVAHNKLQEIVDEANRPDSVIRLEQIILEPETTQPQMQTWVAKPKLLQQWDSELPSPASAGQASQLASPPPVFQTAAEQRVAQLTYEVIQNQGGLPSAAALGETAVREKIIRVFRNSGG